MVGGGWWVVGGGWWIVGGGGMVDGGWWVVSGDGTKTRNGLGNRSKNGS